MALKMFRIKIEKTANTSVAGLMNNMRSWLDNHRIQPVEFKSHSTEYGTVTFEIAFQSEDEAHLFEWEFFMPTSRQIDV